LQRGEEAVDRKKEVERSINATQGQLTAAGPQLLLRLLDGGGTHHIAEGQATEVQLDLLTSDGRLLNPSAEQADRGEIELAADTQQAPDRRLQVLDLDQKPILGSWYTRRPDAGRSRRHLSSDETADRRTASYPSGQPSLNGAVALNPG
jgi:hypothetical protein